MAKQKTPKYERKLYGSPHRKQIIIIALLLLAGLAALIAGIVINSKSQDAIAAAKYALGNTYSKMVNGTLPYDGSDDFDGDGVVNDDEVQLSTDFNRSDSDSDGLSDGDEIILGTDPLYADSDKDGISDGAEVRAHLDPLNTSTDGEVQDGKRTFDISKEFDEGVLNLTGTAAMFATTVDKLLLYSVMSNPAVYSAPYEVYCGSMFQWAEVVFNVSDTTLSKVPAENLSVYKFDPNTLEYELVMSSYDEETKTVHAVISKYGVYLLGGGGTITEDVPLNVEILIDNSGSMYPKSLVAESEENDVDFRRLEFAKELVAALATDETVDIGISKFSYNYDELSAFSRDTVSINSTIESIRTLEQTFDGTCVEGAISQALDNFNEEELSERNLLVVLTDGISTGTKGITIEQICEKAQLKNVSIMTVSLGSKIDRELLQDIADATGGKYYPISEADALSELCASIMTTMSYDMVDISGDGTMDSYSVYDTGFRNKTNALSFKAFRTEHSETLDFGMALLARNWYIGTLPLSMTVSDSFGDDSDVNGYNFTGTNIETMINSHEVLSKILDRAFVSDYADPLKYLNFSSPAPTLSVSNEYRNNAAINGWTIVTGAYTDSERGWNQVEFLRLDLRNNENAIKYAYGEDEMLILKAIAALDTIKKKCQSEPLDNCCAFDSMKSQLSEGIPVMAEISWKESDSTKIFTKTILITALQRSIDNPNEYTLSVYDSTNPSDSTKMEIERTFKVDAVSETEESDFNYTVTYGSYKVNLTLYELAESEQTDTATGNE